MKLSVVMPVYNEAKTIREIVRRVRDVPIEKEILIVDDGSTDGTRDILRELDGTGRRSACSTSRSTRARARRSRSGSATPPATSSSSRTPTSSTTRTSTRSCSSRSSTATPTSSTARASSAAAPRRVLYFWHSVGNRFLTLASNMFTNLNLTDMETCYKVFRREVLQSMTIESHRFGIEPEITAKVARRGYRIYEVPISYYGRTYDEGKKIGWKDAFSALWTIVRHSVRETEDPKNVGHVTLARMAKLEPYNRWLADRFRRALGKRVLEIGAGFGNMTRQLTGRERELVVASDLDPVAVEYLRGTFRDDAERARRLVPLSAGRGRARGARRRSRSTRSSA